MRRICMVLLVAGCTIPTEVSKEDRNKVFTCTDTRDGEVFSFNSNDITEIRHGIGANGHMKFTDLKGVERTIPANADAWLKCDEGKKVDE